MSTTYTFPTIRLGRDTRVYFDHQQVLLMKRHLKEQGKTFVEGQDSIYCLNSKFKYINRDVCHIWPTLEGEKILMTPGEIARTELERAYGRKLTLPERHRKDLLEVTAPRHWDGVVRDPAHLYYTDLNGAYWQCWKWLTLDCVWPRGVGRLPMFELGERVKLFKPARNAVVGISIAHKAHMYHEGTYNYKPFFNPWFNPGIWAHVQAFVHEVACKAIEFGSCYVATDGYLFDDYRKWDRFNGWLDDSDLEYKTLEGEGWLTAWGSWKVGDKSTKRKRKKNLLDHHNIAPESGMVQWLQKKKRIHQGQ